MSASRHSSLPMLGPLERDALEVVWCVSAGGAGTGDVSVREVYDHLGDRGLAYTTISTVLTNLEKKGVLTRTTQGRRLRYRATIGRDEYSAALMREALSYSQDHRASILHFMAGIDQDDVEILRSLIDSTGGRHPDSPSPPSPTSAG